MKKIEPDIGPYERLIFSRLWTGNQAYDIGRGQIRGGVSATLKVLILLSFF